MSDTNRTRQICKEQGVCVDCYAPQDAGQQRQQKLVSAMYCSACGKYERNHKRLRSTCCAKPLRWKQRCPACANTNANEASARRKSRTDAGRCPVCNTAACAQAWDALVEDTDDRNRLKKFCWKEYLPRHEVTRYFLQEHPEWKKNWPAVLADIPPEVLWFCFSPCKTKVRRAKDLISERYAANHPLRIRFLQLMGGSYKFVLLKEKSK